MSHTRCPVTKKNDKVKNVPAGSALDFARGLSFPERVTESSWRADMTRVLNRLAEATRSFKKYPDWSTYQVVVDRVAHVRTVLNVMSELGLYLSGVTGRVQEAAKTWGERQEAQAFEQTRVVVGPWIHGQTKKTGYQQNRAKDEWLCWRMALSTVTEDAIRAQVNKEADRTLLVVPKLSTSVHKEIFLARSQRRALRAGASGYAFRRTDDDVRHILGTEPNERVRATLWQALQNTAPRKEQVQAMVQARLDTAHSSDYVNAAAMAQVHSVMCPKRMGAALEQALAAIAPIVQNQENALIEKGLSRWSNDRSDTGPRSESTQQTLKDVWLLRQRGKSYSRYLVDETRSAGDVFEDTQWAQRPWNKKFLDRIGSDSSLPLPKRAFPAERVRRTIMTDLFAVGGWTVMRADRVGRVPWTLWRYQLTRKTSTGSLERAWVVVAPQPPRVHRASDDAYAAYANMLRTRRSARPGVKGIEPVALVSLPFEWTDDRCVSNLQDMVNLAHEIGHILHFLELPGTGAREHERMAGTLTEYPSVLMEQYALAPDVLRRWSNPRCHPAIKRLAYWQRRVTDHNRLVDFANEVEVGVVDLALHGRSHNADAVIRRIRKRAGLAQLHPRDARGRANFDFDILGGLAYCYAACRALAVQRVGFTPKGPMVAKEVQKYLERIAPVSAEHTFAQHWGSCYGRNPDSDTEMALRRHVQRLIKREKSLVR